MPNVDYTERFERHRIVDPQMCRAGSFRTQDVGRSGYSKRVACISKRTGKWITQAFLIGRNEPIEMKRKLRKQISQMKSRMRRR
jgi:hypothetical protein